MKRKPKPRTVLLPRPLYLQLRQLTKWYEEVPVGIELDEYVDDQVSDAMQTILEKYLDENREFTECYFVGSQLYCYVLVDLEDREQDAEERILIKSRRK